MKVDFLRRVILVSSWVGVSLLIPLPSGLDSCWAQNVINFGQPGGRGPDGNEGGDASDLESVTIFADGSQLTLDLSGRAGSPGEDGGEGLAAECEDQPTNSSANLRGANGGDGGNGGTGGDGGNGGNLTVYTTDRSWLQQIYVVAPGGPGGVGGTGGPGGAGCQCEISFWTQESCTGSPGSPDFTCTTAEYQCQNGQPGRVGTTGNRGRDGNPGTLTLINSATPIVPDQPAANVSLLDLQERGFTLSQNQWETRQGASSLFAPGSILAEEYRELVQRVENSLVLIWNAPQPFSDFAERRAVLQLQSDESINVTLPEDIWLESSIVKQGKITELIVFNAILAEQATQLKATEIRGNGTDLVLVINDLAQHSDLISTVFSLRYRTTPQRSFVPNDFRTRYEGVIPPELISYENNQFTIAIGQLPIGAEFLQPNTNVELDLMATRTFGENLAQQRFNLRETISR